MSATLTLGCTKFALNPSTAPINVSRPLFTTATWNVSSKVSGGTIDHLTVRTNSIPSKSDGGAAGNTVTFNSNVTRLNADLSTGPKGDNKDCLTFKGTVANSTITTGSGSSTAGDFVHFEKAVTATTIATSGKNDSVVFASSSTAGTSVSVGAGADSIRFVSSSKVGTGTVINLGTDTSTDTIRVASKSTFAGSGVVINNFDSSRDRIIVGTTEIKNQTAANNFFGAGSVILNS